MPSRLNNSDGWQQVDAGHSTLSMLWLFAGAEHRRARGTKTVRWPPACELGLAFAGEVELEPLIEQLG